MDVEDCFRMQLVNSYFYQGALQHFANFEEFRMTRWLKFRIETAGKNVSSALSSIAYSVSNNDMSKQLCSMVSKFEEKDLLSRDRAPKTLILKQLRNLLSTVFVNAKKIHFSDLHITKDFMNNLMYDKRAIREKKKIVNNDQERMTFRFTDLNVFETVEHVSFVGCSFESKVLNFLSSKFTNLKSILFESCINFQSKDIEGLFHGRTKSKSLRLVFHNLLYHSKYQNRDQLTSDDLETLKNMGIDTEIKEDVKPSYVNHYRVMDVPDNVVLIPLTGDFDFEIPTKDIIQNYLKKFGIISNFFASELIEKALSSNENDEQVVENVEMILKFGAHLFDLPYLCYEFLFLAISNHYSNTKLWTLLEKYCFYKLPKYSCSTTTTLTKSYSTIVCNVFRGALNAHAIDNDRTCKNLELFCLDLHKKGFKKDFAEYIHILLSEHPSLIIRLAEREMFNPKSIERSYPYGFSRQSYATTETQSAAAEIIEKLIESQKRKRESKEETDNTKKTKTSQQ